MKNEEIERLNTAMKETSDKRLYERYLAVRLRLEGHSFAEIGDLLGRIRQTIIVKKKRLMWTPLFASSRIFCPRTRMEKSP
ncbi:hypothetical protein [Paenibacillus sp. ISL-20]|uniref:hypothetical protein n=1 Tax=Paenibacillus sp. ISL-20 TaxID=2819163 RepID=UPI001BEA96BA|nr:hypothetical protein [Paenibacillus sp. ISL-20]MBT2763365.1 hypothetical protein [Paenibacillus sp. ISL-20]